MKYYFAGSEIKSWRELLIENNVPSVALSFVGLSRRRKLLDNWSVSSNYPRSQEVFLDSGAYTLNNSGNYDVDDAAKLANNYMEFVEANIDRVELVSEFDAQVLGYAKICSLRKEFFDNLDPSKFMPIWHVEYGQEELDRLCSAYEVVGVTTSEIHDMSLIPIFNSMVNRYGVRLHGVAITAKEMMKSVPWDSVSSMSWLSPQLYGDTIVWTGRELKRYPKAYKAQARKKHRVVFMDNGFDHNKIENDDSSELLKLSLWSWQKFVESLNTRVTTKSMQQKWLNAEIGTDLVDTQGLDNRNEKLLPAIPERRETTTIPVLGVAKISPNPEDEDSEEQSFIYKRSESMRVCNGCVLREKCPGFKPNANCLYNIPIEIKTIDQLRAAKNALIEMQYQRVIFMQMSEDLEGGYADPNLSSEIDRLSRLIKAKEDGEKEGINITQTITATSSRPGFLAEHFGQQVSDKVRQLDTPIKADDIIKDSEIFEAEIIG